VTRPKKNAASVAIGDDHGLWSGVWRIWSHKHDVYVAVRSLVGEFKTSLHLAGDPGRAFRSGFVTEAQSAHFRGPGDRVVSATERPSEQVPGGLLICQIIFPDSGLESYSPTYELPKALRRVSRPPNGHVVYVSVVLTAQSVITDGPRFADRPTQVLFSWRLVDGRTLWIVAHDAAMTEENVGVVEAARKAVPASLDPRQLQASADPPPGALRAFLELNSTDGVKRMIDISAAFLRRVGKENT
jgi:hypothetical protein